MESQPVAVEPGPTTTEFWTTVGTGLLALIVELGTLFDHRFNLSGAQALIPALAPVAASLTAGAYSLSRSRVKVAAHQASAQVMTARITAGVAAPTTNVAVTDPPKVPVPSAEETVTAGPVVSYAGQGSQDADRTTRLRRSVSPAGGIWITDDAPESSTP